MKSYLLSICLLLVSCTNLRETTVEPVCTPGVADWDHAFMAHYVEKVNLDGQPEATFTGSIQIPVEVNNANCAMSLWGAFPTALVDSSLVFSSVSEQGLYENGQLPSFKRTTTGTGTLEKIELHVVFEIFSLEHNLIQTQVYDWEFKNLVVATFEPVTFELTQPSKILNPDITKLP